MSALFLSVCDFFIPLGIENLKFRVNEYRPGYVAVANSFLIGSQSVLIDDVCQLETALSFFLDSDSQIIELFDNRFPRTYGDEAKMRSDGVYPFDYSELEAFIDLRKTIKNQFPPSYSYKCVKLDFESVTSESVTSESVTSEILCPCGCNRSLFGRKRYFDASCRKRAERKRNKND